MDLGLDYSGKSPGATAVKAAGYQFVCRYISRYAIKAITKSEYDDYINSGLGVVLVFEDYANNAISADNDYQQGVQDAQFALQQANAIGFPSNRPIYFAVDFDIDDAQKKEATQYMKGIISIIGLARTGAYGGYWWVKYCFDNNLATFGWQAIAWSGGNREARAHLFQRLGGVTVNGTACDVNEALKNDYGQAGGDMPDKIDENASKQIQFSFLARNGLDGRPYALDGSTGLPWLGADLTLKLLNDIFISPESKDGWRDGSGPSSIKDINTRLATIPSLQAQIAALQKQLAQKPVNDGFTPADRATLNWLQKAIASIFKIKV